jgi:hypothetical protein
MKLDGYKGWEHKIRNKFCTLCGEIVCINGFTGCEESDHKDFIRDGYDFCPYCAKELTPHVAKFLDLKVRLCRKCGNKIDREKYVTCFGTNYIPGNPKDANYCQWCGRKI